MKKAILTSLAVVMSVSVAASASYAKTTNSKNGPLQFKRIEVAQTLPAGMAAAASVWPMAGDSISEITGTVEKMNEYDMTVKTKDGKLYSVPLFEFSNMKEFKELNVQKGTEVSLKRVQFPTLNADANVTAGEVGVASIASVEADKAIDDGVTGDKKDVKVFRIFADEKAGEIHKEKLSKEEQEKIADSVNSVNSANSGDVVAAVPAVAVHLEEGTEIFIAGEITANGKTVKAPDMAGVRGTAIRGIPAIAGQQQVKSEVSGTVEKINEYDMTVKAKDGKQYFVPIGMFSTVDGFKALELKEGVEVSLKGFQPQPTKIAFKEKVIKEKADNKTETATETAVQVAEKGKSSAENENDKIVCISAAPTIMLGSGTMDGKESDKVMRVRAVPALKFNNGTVDGKLLFLAEEITANGKTVKIPNP